MTGKIYATPPRWYATALQQLGDVQNFICSLRTLTDEEREFAWTQLLEIRKKFLSSTRQLKPPPHRQIDVQHKLSEIQSRVQFVFFLTFIAAPIISISLHDSSVRSQGRSAADLLSYKSVVCKILLACTLELSVGKKDSFISLHKRLPVTLQWEHFKKVSQLRGEEDPDGTLGKEFFEDVGRRSCEDNELCLLAMASCYSLFTFEIYHAVGKDDLETLLMMTSSHLERDLSLWDQLLPLAVHLCSNTIIQYAIENIPSLRQHTLDSCLLIAAKHGSLFTCQLLARFPFSSDVCMDALEKAATGKHLSLYVDLLPRAARSSDESFIQMLALAATDEDQEAVEILLQHCHFERAHFFSQLLVFAIKNTSKDFIASIVQAYKEDVKERIAEAFAYAASNSRADLIEYFTQQFPEEMDSCKQRGIYEALLYGRYEMICFIMDPTKNVDQGGVQDAALQCIRDYAGSVKEDELNQIFISASRMGYKKLVETLLAQGSTLQTDVLVHATRVASHEQQEEVVLSILRSRLDSFSVGQRTECLQYAIQYGLDLAVDFILQGDYLFDVRGFSDSFQKAHCEGHHKVVGAILNSRLSLEAKDLIRCFYRDAERGDLDSLKALMPHLRTIICYEEIGYAIAFSVENGHDLTCRYLLNSFASIPSERLRLAILRAAEHGRDELFSLLTKGRQFPSGPLFSQLEIHSRIIDACREGKFDVVSFFLRQGRLMEEVRDFGLGQCRGTNTAYIQEMLSRADTMPNTDVVDYERDYDFVVDFAHLQSDPLSYLKNICLYGFPRRIVPESCHGTYDAGGISKDFITTLCSALIENRHIHLTSNRLPIDVTSDVSTYQDLGKLVSILYKQNISRSDPFLLGAIFSPSFFALVKLALITANDDLLQQPFVHVLLESKVPSPYFEAFSYLKAPHETIPQQKFAHILPHLELGDDLKKAACVLLRSFILPVRSFCSQLSCQLIDHLYTLTPEAAAQKILGAEVTKEVVANALTADKEDHHQLVERVGWIKQWLLEVDDEVVKMFVYAVTGSYTYCQTISISVVASEAQNPVFAFKTCTNAIEVPVHSEITQHDFLTQLRWALEERDYNINDLVEELSSAGPPAV